MNILHLLFTFLLTTIEAKYHKKYKLVTQLKPQQDGKQRFEDLYLASYHTGAGLSDAVLIPREKSAIVGFLNGTNGRVGDIVYQNQVFDLGADFPFTLIPEPNTIFYTAWQPVRINVGTGASDMSGFYINGHGLQWTSAPDAKPDSGSNVFHGWLVCNWWHGVPQLFFRLDEEDEVAAPRSCADVWLKPEYV